MDNSSLGYNPLEGAGKPTQFQIQSPEYITPKGLAVKLDMSWKWVEKWTIKRRIPGQVKIGGVWRYSVAAVEKRLLSGGNFLLDPIKPLTSATGIKFPIPTARPRIKRGIGK